MAYTYSLASADGDGYSAETFPSSRRCDQNNTNNRLHHQHLVDRHHDRRRHQTRWRSSGVGVTFTLSGTICPLHGEHSSTDLSEDPPTTLSELAAPTAAHHRRPRNACTSERDTGWRDPTRGSRDTYRDDQEVAEVSVSLGYGCAEPGTGRTRCPTGSRPHQCPTAAPTRLSPRYGGGQQGTRRSVGSGQPVRVPPHVSAAQQRSATETEQKNSGAPRSRFRDLGTSAPPPAGAGTYQGRSKDLKTPAPPAASYVSPGSIREPLVGDKSWAVPYLPREEAAPPPAQRGRGVARGAVVLDRRGNQEPEATPAAAAPKKSVRSLQWNARLEEARIMKHELGRALKNNRGLRDSNSQLARQVVALRSRVETLLPSTCTNLAEPETGCVVKDKHGNGIHQAHQGGHGGDNTYRLRDVETDAAVTRRSSEGNIDQIVTENDTVGATECCHDQPVTGQSSRSQSSNTQPRAEAHAQTQTGAELLSGNYSEPAGWRAEAIHQRGGGAASCRNSEKERREPASVSISTSPTEGKKALDEEVDACSSSAKLTTPSSSGSESVTTPNSGGGPAQDTRPSAAAATACERSSGEETSPCQGPEPHRGPVGRVEVIVGGKKYCGGLDLDGRGVVAVAAQCPEEGAWFARPGGIPNRGETLVDHGGVDPARGNVNVCANEVASARETDGGLGSFKLGTKPGVPAISIQPLVGEQVEVGECLVEPAEGTNAVVTRVMEPVSLGRVCSTTTIDAPPVSSEQALKSVLQENIETQASPSRVEGGGVGDTVSSEPERKPSDGTICTEATQGVVQVELHRTRRTLAAFKIAFILGRRGDRHGRGGCIRRATQAEGGLGAALAFFRWRSLGCGPAASRELIRQLRDSATGSAFPRRQEDSPPQPQEESSSSSTNDSSFEIATPPPAQQQQQLQSKGSSQLQSKGSGQLQSEGSRQLQYKGSREDVEEMVPGDHEGRNAETGDTLPSTAETQMAAASSADWMNPRAEDHIHRDATTPIEESQSFCLPVPPVPPLPLTRNSSAYKSETIRALPHVSVPPETGTTPMPPMPYHPAVESRGDESVTYEVRRDTGGGTAAQHGGCGEYPASQASAVAVECGGPAVPKGGTAAGVVWPDMAGKELQNIHTELEKMEDYEEIAREEEEGEEEEGEEEEGEEEGEEVVEGEGEGRVVMVGEEEEEEEKEEVRRGGGEGVIWGEEVEVEVEADGEVHDENEEQEQEQEQEEEGEQEVEGGEEEEEEEEEEGEKDGEHSAHGVRQEECTSSYRRDCAVLAGTAKIMFALLAVEHRRVSSRFYRWKRMRRELENR